LDCWFITTLDTTSSITLIYHGVLLATIEFQNLEPFKKLNLPY
jgi:hypothetical protein